MAVRYPLVLNGTAIEELQAADTLGGVSTFDAGTAMLFAQTAAPTGWTKSTTHNDKALRVVSGTASSGGSYPFTTAFADGSAGATTLSTAQMPSHTHIPANGPNNSGSPIGGLAGTTVGFAAGQYGGVTNYSVTTTGQTGYQWLQSTGGGGSHTHSLSLAVQYVDVIIATKN